MGLFFRLIFLFSVAVASAAGQERLFVLTLDDFQLHTEAHIRRVERLGLELRRLFPGEFGKIDSTLLREFLALHDQAKVADRDRLARLYQLYGRTLSDPNERELIATINRADARTSRRFLRKEGLLDARGEPTEVARQLLRIEKIADLVDRYRSPVSAEEFSKVMSPASEFLPHPADRALARALERTETYDRAVRGLTFEQLRKRARERRCLRGVLAVW